MAGLYCRGTTVPVDQSKGELMALLARYGASNVQIQPRVADGYQWMDLDFDYAGRRVGLTAPMPLDHREEPQLWRVLVLVVHARLESTAWGITNRTTSAGQLAPPPVYSRPVDERRQLPAQVAQPLALPR